MVAAGNVQLRNLITLGFLLLRIYFKYILFCSVVVLAVLVVLDLRVTLRIDNQEYVCSPFKFIQLCLLEEL